MLVGRQRPLIYGAVGAESVQLSTLAKSSTVHRHTLQSHAALEVCAVIEVMLGFLRWHGPRTLQPCRLRDQVDRRLKVLVDVGPEMQNSLALKLPFDVL